LSGDIHGGEISELGSKDANKFGIDYTLYEITSCGLTHLRPLYLLYLWTNKYQIGFTPDRNFGEIDIVKHRFSQMVKATYSSPNFCEAKQPPVDLFSHP